MLQIAGYLKKERISLLLANAFFLILFASNALFTAIYSGVDLIGLLFFALCILAVVFNNRALYMLTGTALALISCYLMLAVTSDIFKYLDEPQRNPGYWKNLTFGYLFTGSGVVFAIIYIIYGGKPKNHVIGAAKAL